MPFGDIFAKIDNAVLETADNKQVKIEKNPIFRLGLKILGIPHIGLRVRANRIFGMVKKNDGKILLDAGCGPGTYAITLAQKGYDVYGFDINKSKIVQAKNLSKQLNLKTTFAVKNIYNLSTYKTNFFDIVICSDVLEHLKDDNKAVKEMLRIIKPGGKLIITVPADTPTNLAFKKQFMHERLYTKEELEALLTKNNLLIINSRCYLCFFGRIAWKINRALFKSKMLTALTFYPLYLLTFLDYIFRAEHGDGLVVKGKKISK